MYQIVILKSMLDKVYFLRFYPILSKLKNIPIEHQLLLKSIWKYYTEYEDRDTIRIDEIESFFSHQNPGLKNPEGYKILFTQLREVTIDNLDLINDIFTQVLETFYCAQIAQESIAMVEGQKLTVMDSIDQLSTKFREDAGKVNAIEDEFCTLSLEDLIEEEQTGGTPWHLKFLNETLGLLKRGTLGHIFARPNCYSDDTEILTAKRGWRLFKDLVPADKVAQVLPNREVEFVFPEKYIEQAYSGEMIHIYGSLNRMDLLVTPEHRMAYTLYNNTQRIKTAKDIVYFQGVKTHTAAQKHTGRKHLSAHERFLIAYQADGTGPKRGCDSSKCGHVTVRFSFSKQRKKDRLRSILDQTRLKYHVLPDRSKPGHYHTFYVECPVVPFKSFEWVDLESVSEDWCQEFIDELSYWDATRRTNKRFRFVTTDFAVAEMVQAVCAIGSMNCNYTIVDTDNPKHSPFADMSLRLNYQPLDGQSIKKEKVRYKGKIYCVTVPSGLLLVRRNKRMVICGNSGKTSLAINIACNAAARFELAKTDDIVLYLGNEEKIDSLKLRAYTAFANQPVSWIGENMSQAKALWERLGGNRIHMVDGVVHIAQVERYLKHSQPTVTIIDQGAKVGIYNRDVTGVERLQQLYNMLRNKAKEHNTAMITLGQASNDAENKKWLKLNMLDGSKVGVPGELDFAIGIGFIEGEDGVRYLNIAKKKRGKFGRTAVAFSEETGKYSNPT